MLDTRHREKEHTRFRKEQRMLASAATRLLWEGLPVLVAVAVLGLALYALVHAGDPKD